MPLLRWLVVALLTRFAQSKMLAPMRRDTALKLLDRLDSSPDLLSIDIGGTLAKVLLFQPCESAPPEGELPAIDLGEAGNCAFGPEHQKLSIYSPSAGGNLHFFVFESRFVGDVIKFMGTHWKGGVPQAAADGSGTERARSLVMRATGGGAYKYAHELRAAGVVLKLVDEMGAIVAGLSFLLRRIPGELFTVDMATGSGAGWTPLATPAACAQLAHNYVDMEEPPESYLYVSIGSGVSILEVHCADSVPRYRRVGGSSVGGSTFWGLVRLLTSCSTFDEVIRLTESGSSSNVDMLVGDIYGGDCAAIGLRSDVIAASFGKVSMQREDDRAIGPMLLIRWLQAVVRHYEEGFWLVLLAVLNFIPGINKLVSILGLARFAENRAASVAMCGHFRAHDVALSLLRMVSNNIGHISTMSAQQHGMKHIVFGGSFIRDHPYTIATISSGVRFYSQGAVQALFLKHDGFVGAVGAHVAGLPDEGGAAVRMPDAASGGGAPPPTLQPQTLQPQPLQTQLLQPQSLRPQPLQLQPLQTAPQPEAPPSTQQPQTQPQAPSPAAWATAPASTSMGTGISPPAATAGATIMASAGGAAVAERSAAPPADDLGGMS